MVRAELEQAGFEVAITYEQFAPAVQKVYSSDPAALEWHIYTEGWGRGAPQRYDVGNVNSFNAPWLGNMPGWREEGFWQYENAELDELGKKLYRGEFDSREERDEIYRTMTAAGLDESIRVWLATVNNSFPVVTSMEGLTRDLVAGPRNPWALREAYVPGSDDVRVGHQWVWTERTTYNPVGGLGDVYSVDLWRNLTDPPIWNDPFTGIPQPFRATYDVETAGPDGTLEVPADALTWDVESKTWVPVAPGTQAVSKVTFDYSRYTGSNWHHGQPITMADAIYSIAQTVDRAYDPEKAKIETALAATARPVLETFKGYRMTDDDHLEVYVDYWHFDADHIAAYASPVSFDMPWEVKAAMDDLVFEQRRAAYSDTAASRYSVPWLSLVLERDAGLVDRTLRDMERDETVPAGVFEFGDRTLVTPEEAVARYQAAQAWFDEKEHLVISDGPFYLEQFDPPAQFAELLAFRDPSYPFKPGDLYRGEPPELSIDAISADPIVPGEDAVVTATVTGPGTVGLRYLLLDPAVGEVVVEGSAEQAAEGQAESAGWEPVRGDHPGRCHGHALPGLLPALPGRRVRFAGAHHRAAGGPRGAALKRGPGTFRAGQNARLGWAANPPWLGARLGRAGNPPWLSARLGRAPAIGGASPLGGASTLGRQMCPTAPLTPLRSRFCMTDVRHGATSHDRARPRPSRPGRTRSRDLGCPPARSVPCPCGQGVHAVEAGPAGRVRRGLSSSAPNVSHGSICPARPGRQRGLTVTGQQAGDARPRRPATGQA